MPLAHFTNPNTHLEKWIGEEFFHPSNITELDIKLEEFNKTIKIGKVIAMQHLMPCVNGRVIPIKYPIVNPAGEDCVFEREAISHYFYLQVDKYFYKMSLVSNPEYDNNFFRERLPKMYSELLKNPEVIAHLRYINLKSILS